jgi:hypothetical protein
MKILLLFVAIVFLTFCSQPEAVKPEPPDVVRWVNRTTGTDTTEAEAGIDAAENSGSDLNAIQLMWYKNSEQNLIRKYNIYRSEDEFGAVNYKRISEKITNQPGIVDTVFFDAQDLQLNVRYYYYITAVDKDGQESDPSDTLAYTLLEKASHLSLNGNSSEVKALPLTFQWDISSGQTPDQYILRIEAAVTDNFHPLVYVNYIPSIYQTPQSYVLNGTDIKSILPNGSYRWRIDCVGENKIDEQIFSGSESDWSVFRVNWSDE